LHIYTNPFPHAVITPPEDIYNYVKSVYPAAPTLDPGARTNLEVSDTRITTYLDSVLIEAFEAFLPTLSLEYPKMNFSSIQTAKRYLFSHNTPNLKPNVIRGLHLDNGTKIVVGLWYFKDSDDDAGGDLFLVNPHTKQSTIFKYDTNKLIIFPNLLTSWHAVTQRAPSSVPRKFINIVMESDIYLHSYNKVGNQEPKVKVVNNFK
jgi:hypothetical protein